VKRLSHEKRAARRKRIADYAKTHGKDKAAQKYGVSIGTVDASIREHGGLK